MTNSLDAGDKNSSYSEEIEYHKVPVLDEAKYMWVKNTPEGKTAFDNQCINPKCLFQGNTTHGSSHDENGINKANQSTPIYCQQCGELLPRPWVEKNGVFRLMKGYTSAYKRMDFDSPSSTLTRNLSYACSDNKLHPIQNRVLSIYEAMILHTLDRYDFDWKRSDGKKVSDKLIRELIGESVPPYGLSKLFEHLIKIYSGEVDSKSEINQGQLCLALD